MGILNVTPDSFWDGGRFSSRQAAVHRAQEMIYEGADIIDIGGESTRPAGPYGKGAPAISVDEEIRRTIPVVEAVCALGIPVSIDTTKAEVARQAVSAGARIINDVSALRFDPEMASVVAESDASVVQMHMQGTPQTMQKAPHYQDIVLEISEFLQKQAEVAVGAGVRADRILLDPGLGFGKAISHNFEIVARLAEFHPLGHPLLVGASRKGFTGHPLRLPPEERLEGSLGVLSLCAERGAHLFRVHDVAASHRLLTVVESVRESASGKSS